jgi:hypothetical protein
MNSELTLYNGSTCSRLGGFEFMAELCASPLRFRDWLSPSSLRTERGDWLAWCGPLHVAVSRV